MKEEEIIPYLEECLEGGADPNLKGHEAFEYLFRCGVIDPWFTTIRVMYTGVIDLVYWADENGKLIRIGDEENKPLEPKEVLSIKKHPDGWDMENLSWRNLEQTKLPAGN